MKIGVLTFSRHFVSAPERNGPAQCWKQDPSHSFNIADLPQVPLGCSQIRVPQNDLAHDLTEEETFIDEAQQKVLYRWQLDWPSLEKGYEGQQETRRGVDVIHFKDGKIISKLTYSKTTLLINGKRILLSAQPSGH